MAADELAGWLGMWANGPGPLYETLAESLRSLLRDGVLRGGDRLPAERALASALSVSRGTVVAAYDALRDLGEVLREQGRGTTVRTDRAIDPAHGRPRGDPLFQATPASIDLLMAVPEPLPRVMDLVGRVRFTDPALLASAEPAGLPPLRQAIAARMTAEGLPTEAEQIIVTAGAQQGIALVTSMLTTAGDVVLTEETTWPGLADSVRRLGARVVGVPMDDDGIVVDELVAAIERFRPAFIGLNPHHHNPTGSRLSPRRRAAVADVAADYCVPLVEDRVVAGLAFDGRVPTPLASHRPEAVNLVLDSINKSAWSGLRLGWIRSDTQSIADLRSARALADLFSPIPSQLMAIEVLTDLDAVIADRVEQLADRAAVLQHAVTEQLPDWRLRPVRGGLVAWAQLPWGSASAFVRLAARYGVAVAGGREFSSSVVVDDHIRLPFSASEAVLREAVARLAEAWRAFPRTEAPAPLDLATIV